MANESERDASAGLEGKLTLRSERPHDEAFLFEVYASTRQEELALTGWDARTRMAFLQMQFKAMRQGYASQHPKAEFSVILFSGNPVGRMVVDRSQETVCLVDLALLLEHRGQGIGTILMQELLAEAARIAKSIRLHVFKQSRPIRWYERLGFCKTGDNGAYDCMEWHPGRSALSELPN